MSAQAIRPSRLWYWVAGAAAVGAVVWLGLGLVLGFLSMDRQVEGFQRVPIPGQAEVSFAEPGGYTLYFEGVGASDEQATIPPFDVSLASVGGGEEVLIRPYGGSVSYSFAGHEGQAGSCCGPTGNAVACNPMSPLDPASPRRSSACWSQRYPEPSSCCSAQRG